MSDYTDEQAVKFYAALEGFDPPGEQQLAAHWGRKWLDSLAAEGITVDFPKPRFRVVKRPGAHWSVCGAASNASVADFIGGLGGHPAPQFAAEREAARLNGEVGR